MSGGVDSSAVCIMLQERGYEVVGVTMRTWDLESQFSSPQQRYPNFILEAKELAARLGIEHHVVDFRDSFKEVVVANFVDEYMNGRTPNPCVLCNPLFKFKMLMDFADTYNCSYISTGHYISLQEIAGKIYLVTGDDAKKDQSYFLWKLGQDVLRRSIFPLGAYTKKQVRQYLFDKGFVHKSADAESMEVCFIQGDYRDFLQKQLGDKKTAIKPGKFVNRSGVTLGTHKGVPFYTIGQRKGLEIALGHPAYVIGLNALKNTVILGPVEQLKKKYMLIEPPQFVDEKRWKQEKTIEVCIRYRSKPIPCSLEQVTDSLFLVTFEEEARAITPGQSTVFYVGKRVIGGAFIASQRGLGMYIADKERTNKSNHSEIINTRTIL